MLAFQKILFPIDLSDSCTAAAPLVEAMAKKFQAQVTLLHILEMPPDVRHGLVRLHGPDRYRCDSRRPHQ